MEKLTIQLNDLLKKVKTYPSWTTNREYPLSTKKLDNDNIRVYYQIAGPIKRVIKRTFPLHVKLTPRFIWSLGFLKGEGSNSLGKSNYRRFTITNTNPGLLAIVLEELEASKLFDRRNIIVGGINILHSKAKEDVAKEYWSRQLKVPIEKTRYYNDEVKTSEFGVCHIYISDVLLRRVVDEICSYVMKSKRKE